MSNTKVFMWGESRRAGGAPHENRDRHHQPGFVRQGHVPLADPETIAHPRAALGVHHFRPSPGILDDADVAYPHPVRKASTHALHDGLFGGESHGQKTHRPGRALELRPLFGHQEMADEPLAVLLEHPLDSFHLEHIDSDSEYHRRAARIKSFMSRTALGSPSNIARATMACPMFNSTISGIAAIGSTLC